MTKQFPMFVIAALSASAALAEPASPPTPAPVIYLADNLDEPQSLGYCLDTVGRGRSDRLHIHSCKPRGGDVQFAFNEATGQIASHAFEGLCAEVSSLSPSDVEFRLLPCAGTAPQRFTHDPTTKEISPAEDRSLCLGSAPESRRAGPFEARDLVLADCATLPTALKQWIVDGG